MKVFYRFICFVLSAVITVSVLFESAAAAGAVSYPSRVPVIYIHGEGSPIGTYDENGEFHRIDDMTVNGEEIASLFTDNSDILLKATVTQAGGNVEHRVVLNGGEHHARTPPSLAARTFREPPQGEVVRFRTTRGKCHV